MSVTFRLNFPGTCAQAVEIYKKAFDARVLSIVKYSEVSVDEVPNVDERLKDGIYICEIELSGEKVILSDVIMDRAPLTYGTMSACVMLPGVPDVHRALTVLKTGGWVIISPRVSRKSACEAEIIDKFGVRWFISSEKTPEFEFRPFLSTDAGDVEGIIRASAAEAYQNSSAAEAREAYAGAFAHRMGREAASGALSGRMMTQNGESMGVMIYGPGRAAGSAEIYAFYLLPSIRRRGAGHFMMDALISCLVRDGYNRCRLWVPAADMHTRFFFDDCGFSLVNEERTPCKGYNEIRYELMLNEY